MKIFYLSLLVFSFVAAPIEALSNDADIWNAYIYGCLPVENCATWSGTGSSSWYPADVSFEELSLAASVSSGKYFGRPLAIKKELLLDSYGCFATDDEYVDYRAEYVHYSLPFVPYACIITDDSGQKKVFLRLLRPQHAQNGERPLFPTGYQNCSIFP